MKKLYTSILLVTGTIIGGGMVILPALIGVYGYLTAMLVLIAMWFITTTIALIFLEANYYLSPKTSFISLSRCLLGPYAEWLAWALCLAFLYSILSAYTVGISESLTTLTANTELHIPTYTLSALAVLLISISMYCGMKYIHQLNKFIVFGVFVTFAGLVIFLFPKVEIHHLFTTPLHSPTVALPILFTSFGFLVTIPGLRVYLEDNVTHLRTAIIVGSFIPLLIYIIWVTTVMSVIPIHGGSSLTSILASTQPVESLTNTFILQTGNSHLGIFIHLFIVLAIISSFIGTALGLYDFLADGLKLPNTGAGKLSLLSLTFIPPLLIPRLMHHVFITALGFAGLVSVIIFGLYPVMLTWSGRYSRQLNTVYRTAANRFTLILIAIFSFAIIGIEIINLKTTFFS